MQLSLHDLHWIFNAGARTLKAYDAAGKLVFSCEARNRTTADGQYGHYGNLPPGEYVFGTPVPKGTAPFGPFAIPITDAPGHHELEKRGRSGLMWHGGGSGLTDPLADRQSPPWVVTHGCERSLNHDLKAGVALIEQAHRAGGVCYVTNEDSKPGLPQDDDDWLLDSQLDPEE